MDPIEELMTNVLKSCLERPGMHGNAREVEMQVLLLLGLIRSYRHQERGAGFLANTWSEWRVYASSQGYRDIVPMSDQVDLDTLVKHLRVLAARYV